MTVPFLHAAWWAAFAIAWACARATPLRERRWLPPLIAAAVAAALALAGVVPWIGEYQLTAYGACLGAAFIVAYLVALARLPRIRVTERQLIDVTLIALVGGIVGARARFVWENRDEYLRAADGSARPWSEAFARMADFDGGGMVWYGGMILATSVIAVYAWRKRVPLLPLCDVLAPAMLIGLGIGRLGCWFNGCCYGAPTTVPWGVLRPGHPTPIHPTQLYEMAATILLATALLAFSRRPRRTGLVSALAAVGYGCWRFFNESLRGDHHPGARAHLWGFGEISTSQATSVYLVLIGLALLAWVLLRRQPPAATAPEPPADAAAR